MATLQEYFTSDSLDTPLTPTGWTDASLTNAWQVHTDPVYGRRLTFSTNNNGTLLLNSTAGSSLTSCEILLLVRAGDVPNSQGASGLIRLRCNTSNFNSIILFWNVNSDFTTSFFYSTSNSAGDLVNNSGGSLSKPWALGDLFWVRFGITGNTRRLTIWNFGDTEPSSPDSTNSLTTSLPASGSIGIQALLQSSVGINNPWEFLYAGIGTNGDPAPWPKLLPTKVANSQSFKTVKIRRPIYPTLLDNLSSFYPLTLYPGLVHPSRFINGNAFYGPTIVPEHLFLGAPYLPSTEEIYPPSVDLFNIVRPSILPSQSSFGPAVIETFYELYPELFEEDNSFGFPHLGFFSSSPNPIKFKNYRRPTSGLFRGFHYSNGNYY